MSLIFIIGAHDFFIAFSLAFRLEDINFGEINKNATMIHSMTGFGKAEVCFNQKKVHIEIKSLNSKSMDITTRIAPLYREKELEIRKIITDSLVRGKVDFALWIEADTNAEATPLNQQVIAAYAQQLRTISRDTAISLDDNHLWELLVRLPGITTPANQEELSADEWNATLDGIRQAIANLQTFRLQEGKALYAKFLEKLANISSLMAQIEPFEKNRIESIKNRIRERLSELKDVAVDKNRFEQELIYYIEKLDINEEKQRLSNHLDYFRNTMDSSEGGQGKKLGFIAQEMGREINTTGSKSNQAEMQNIVVQMKDELEQIKEQVLNVL